MEKFRKQDIDIIINVILDMISNNMENTTDSIGESLIDWCEGGNIFYDMEGVDKEQAKRLEGLMKILDCKVEELTNVLYRLYDSCIRENENNKEDNVSFNNSLMNKVYVVTEDWKIDSGESGIYSSVFSTFKKALEYFEKLRERYEVDYETKVRLVDESVSVVDELDEESEYAELEVAFEDSADYYRIWIEDKNIDSEE